MFGIRHFPFFEVSYESFSDFCEDYNFFQEVLLCKEATKNPKIVVSFAKKLCAVKIFNDLRSYKLPRCSVSRL